MQQAALFLTARLNGPMLSATLPEFTEDDDGAISDRFLVHHGQHLLLSERNAVGGRGAIKRYFVPLAPLPPARHLTRDEPRAVCRQAGQIRLHVARYRASRRDVWA